MYSGIGMSASSLHRESTDSLIVNNGHTGIEQITLSIIEVSFFQMYYRKCPLYRGVLRGPTVGASERLLDNSLL